MDEGLIQEQIDYYDGLGWDIKVHIAGPFYWGAARRAARSS